uniref:S-locus cysteine-rich-like protein n=1 Tax=Leavenworthia alabamica TaxID=310722 RepID=R9S9K4_LEAAL|nr:S-locus cysteine-rich-like protein [Leavenworthia alabamica]
MAKSVWLTSFISYLMISMLISTVIPKPHNSGVPSRKPSSTCGQQKGDESCKRLCLEIKGYLSGKCKSYGNGKFCECCRVRPCLVAHLMFPFK